MDKLQELISKCKYSVEISVNAHRDSYEKPAEWLERFEVMPGSDVYDMMLSTDTIVDLTFYPRNTVGFYQIFHYDVEKAIDDALDIINPTDKNF